MIGWPLSPACAVACLFGEESQHPIFPQVMHMRRWTQLSPIFRHSSHPAIVSGSRVTSIWSRWLQMLFADMRLLSLPLAFRARGQYCEISRGIGPPRLDAKAGTIELELEPLPSELRADLRPEALSALERELELETPHQDRVRLERAEADVHPFVLRIPGRLEDETPLLERRVQLAVHGGERVPDERLRRAVRVVVRGVQAGEVLHQVETEQEHVIVSQLFPEREQER